MKKILSILFLSTLVAACVKMPKGSDNASAPNINEIIISPEFDWKTSKDFKLSIYSDFTTLINITSLDGVVSYHKGYNNNAPDNYYVTITVPSNISSVKVNEQEINLDSPELSIVLPDGQTKSSGSMFFAALAPTLPLASWNFDEASGISAIDLIGSNNGTISNATRTDGVLNRALEFNGSSSYVTIPSNPDLTTVEAITVMAWVYPQQNKTSKVFYKGNWKGFNSIGQDVWKGWNCEIALATNSKVNLEWGGGRPLLNEWYHLAMTYNGSTLSLYVNGLLKASKPASGDLLVTPSDLYIGSINGGQDYFKGKIDEVALYGVALSAQEIQSIAQTSASPDKDGDGIPNVNDDYPDNPTMAFNNYYPAAGHGSLAFEDMWPSKGDYDFNDLVLDYRFNIITDASNFIAKISCNFVIKAIGAGYRNGFGFQLNAPLVDISTLDVVGATLDNAETLPTIIVFNNANNLMSPVSGFGVNVVKENPYVEPVSLDVHITFNEHIYTIDNLNMSEFNPFIFIEGDRAREVHLADFPPTKSASTALFGKEEDTSNPGIGRYYKTASNLPWAINLFSGFDHVVERIEITDAYLKFAAWAGSAGVEFPDWYLDKAGYRLSQNIY